MYQVWDLENNMKRYFEVGGFTQLLFVLLAPYAAVSASEIPSKVTQMYSSGGFAAGSRQTAYTAAKWYEILNSGGVVSNAQKFDEVGKSQLSTQDDMKDINYIEQITSVLDATGLEHLSLCTSYLTEDNMGTMNIKLKTDLMQGLETQKETGFTVKRPSKNACKELFSLILN